MRTLVIIVMSLFVGCTPILRQPSPQFELAIILPEPTGDIHADLNSCVQAIHDHQQRTLSVKRQTRSKK